MGLTDAWIKYIEWLISRVEQLEAELERVESKREGLEKLLAHDTAMLARQCDLAREAEARVKELEHKLVLTHSDLTDVIAENIRLRDAIEKHKDTVTSWHTDMFPEDEELYAVLEQKTST